MKFLAIYFVSSRYFRYRLGCDTNCLTICLDKFAFEVLSRLDTVVTSEARQASHDAVILPMMIGRWFQRKTNSGRDCEVEEEALRREEQYLF
ncbi:hypothetical protein Hanom_Chr14g01325661 [Helianthus anomalus]